MYYHTTDIFNMMDTTRLILLSVIYIFIVFMLAFTANQLMSSISVALMMLRGSYKNYFKLILQDTINLTDTFIFYLSLHHLSHQCHMVSYLSQ